MAKKQKFRSLTVKLLAMLLVSAVAAGIIYCACNFLGRELVDQVWRAPAQSENRLNTHIASLRKFVEEHSVSSTDAAAIGQWNRGHMDVRLTVNGRNTILNTDGTTAEITLSDSGLSLRLDDHTGYQFPVNFSDGTYTVSIYDHSETRLYNAVNIASIVISAAVFLLLMVLYERHVTLSILRLSRQVRQVSRGDLQKRIHSPAQDEIGQLAEDVESMRLGILDKLHREENAWKANSDLITAISHDVRTPLTALMGYLDILSDPELPTEIQRAYLEICRNNAARLKDLTNELFGFSLVFGNQGPEQNIEQFDAATLLEQIFLEAGEELTGQGFTVDLQLPQDLCGTLLVDLGHLRRVFDNLFSNLRKYADPALPVNILVSVAENQLAITMTNAILTGANRVESNKIGLKTCEKLLLAMGGGFRQSRTANTFTAEVSLPLYSAK